MDIGGEAADSKQAIVDLLLSFGIAAIGIYFLLMLLFIFAEFYAGYMLGKGSGGSVPKMKPGMPEAEQVPSSPNPTFQRQDTPPSSTAMTVAWVSPMETSQEDVQASENTLQRRSGMDGAVQTFYIRAAL